MGDSHLQSISWLPNQEDVQIGFVLPDEQSITIHFTWVTNFKIEMDFGDQIGMGLTWEVKFKKRLNEEWNVNIEFGGAPDGGISFDCNSFKLVE